MAIKVKVIEINGDIVKAAKLVNETIETENGLVNKNKVEKFDENMDDFITNLLTDQYECANVIFTDCDTIRMLPNNRNEDDIVDYLNDALMTLMHGVHNKASIDTDIISKISLMCGLVVNAGDAVLFDKHYLRAIDSNTYDLSGIIIDKHANWLEVYQLLNNLDDSEALLPRLVAKIYSLLSKFEYDTEDIDIIVQDGVITIIVNTGAKETLTLCIVTDTIDSPKDCIKMAMYVENKFDAHRMIKRRAELNKTAVEIKDNSDCSIILNVLEMFLDRFSK